MQPIQTFYYPNNSSAQKIQYWLPILSAQDYFATDGDIQMLVSRLTQFIEKIKLTNLNASPISFIPVSVGIVPEGHNRTIYCGFEPSSEFGKPKPEPVDPIIVRGKALPEFIAQVTYTGKDHIYLHTRFSSNLLTTGQRNTLNTWFGKQLTDAATEELLAELKNTVVQQTTERTQIYLRKLLKNVTTAEADILKICRHK